MANFLTAIVKTPATELIDTKAYWKDLYSQIDSQAIADKLFDMGILLGVGIAVGILQLALRIPQDGIFGSETLTVVNQADESSLLMAYKANLVTHIFNVAKEHPAERAKLRETAARINS